MLELISRLLSHTCCALLLSLTVCMTTFAGFSADFTGPNIKTISPKSINNTKPRPVSFPNKITIRNLYPKKDFFLRSLELQKFLIGKNTRSCNMPKTPALRKNNKPFKITNPFIFIRLLWKFSNKNHIRKSRSQLSIESRSFAYILEMKDSSKLFLSFKFSPSPLSRRTISYLDPKTMITKPRPLLQARVLPSSIQSFPSNLKSFPAYAQSSFRLVHLLQNKDYTDTSYDRKHNRRNSRNPLPFCLLFALSVGLLGLGGYVAIIVAANDSSPNIRFRFIFLGLAIWGLGIILGHYSLTPIIGG